jgi:uncharacterized damage-inducible protein DinB
MHRDQPHPWLAGPVEGVPTALQPVAHALLQGATVASLVADVDAQVARALDQLRATDAATLADARAVGAKRLPSTVAGLLFHAAEHAQRHCGQLLVTSWVVRERHGVEAG